MSGVVTGQVFSEDELELLMDWSRIISAHASAAPADHDHVADVKLGGKIRDYLDRTACRVPR